MLALNRSNILRQKIVKLAARSWSTQQLPASSDEYTEKPIYPEILDTSIESRNIRQKQSWHEEIQNLKTIEEKQIKINMPRYYGYKTVMLTDKKLPYNCLPLSQHYTRTVFETIEKLPSGSGESGVYQYQANESKIDQLVEEVKGEIEESLELSREFFNQKYGENTELSPKEKEAIFAEIAVEQINRTLINALSGDFSHLSEAEVDSNPRHEAFWLVGGINPPKNVRKGREGLPWQKDRANEPVDRAVQYIGNPLLTLRHRHPLSPILEEKEYSSTENLSKVPLFQYDSRVLGYECEYRHGTSVPGFWPGSPNDFGLLSYQRRDHSVIRNPSFGAADFQESLHAQGIQSSFAWTLAQAYYQGFTTFNDLTYPLNTQTVITNGKEWSFYVYQLNTSLVHSSHVSENPKSNFCWGTKEMKLYEEIDAQGKCIGFNADVLKFLISFYANVPAERTVNLKPYLGKDERQIAHIEDEDRRVFLERTFKHMVSNRPRHLEIPEIYAWEKIYKMDNKTRPMEAKRRFFELEINPWKRTMDDRALEYIPRVVRPGGPKSKNKFKKTYYP